MPTRELSIRCEDIQAFQWLEYVFHCVTKNEKVLPYINGAPFIFLNKLQEEMEGQRIALLRDHTPNVLSIWERAPLHRGSQFSVYARQYYLWGMLYYLQGNYAIKYDPRGRAVPCEFFRCAECYMWQTQAGSAAFMEIVKESIDWRSREAMASQFSYVPVPWKNDAAFPAMPGHYAHVHPTETHMVRYTQNAEKGMRGVHTSIKGGRYLAKYYPTADHVTIAKYAASMAKSGVLQFAKKADEIEKVYREGPPSCMTHPRTSYASVEHHPTAVYGDSDIQIAYMQEGGAVVARAVCWPERKIYGRIYGMNGNENKIRNGLEAAGFKNGTLKGARIRRINMTNGRILMPYIDGIEHGSVRKGEEDTFVTLGEMRNDPEFKINSIFVQTTGGYTNFDTKRCSCCGDICHNGRDFDGEYLCEGCADNMFFCDRTQRSYNGAEYEAHTVITEYYNEPGYVEARRTQVWCEIDLEQYAFRCAFSSCYVSRAAAEECTVFSHRRGFNANRPTNLNQFREEIWSNRARDQMAMLASDGETWVRRDQLAQWETLATSADTTLAALRVSTNQGARTIADNT